MLFTITYQDIELQHALSVLSHELLHPHELLTSLGEALHPVHHDRHLAGLAPDGSPWAPLKPGSLIDKRRGGPLDKSGEMLDSYIYQVESDVLIFGFDGARNARLAVWHHEGTDPYVIKPKNGKALKFGDHIVKKANHPGLPARELVGYPASDERLVADETIDHIEWVLKNR